MCTYIPDTLFSFSFSAADKEGLHMAMNIIMVLRLSTSKLTPFIHARFNDEEEEDDRDYKTAKLAYLNRR